MFQSLKNFLDFDNFGKTYSDIDEAEKAELEI